MSWAHYILQVNIYLVIFYGFYKLLLDKETYFTLNRIYLVSAGVLSLAIPFLRFEWITTQPAAQPLYVGVDQLSQLVTQVAVVQQNPEIFTIGNFIVLIYLGGVLFFLCRFIYQLFAVQKAIKQSKANSAFSFLKKKIIDSSLPNSSVIDKHEEVHVRQLHTIDVLLFEILGIINWFNPIIYLYKSLVKNIHEYLADEAAVGFQGDREEYSLILLSSALGINPSDITNQFYNKSLIKKRIFMLHKQRSARTAILKYGLFAPLFALMLTLSSATIRDNEKIQQISNEVQVENPIAFAKEIINETIADKGKNVSTSKNTPLLSKSPVETKSVQELPADWKEFYTYIQRSIKYPAEARSTHLQGNVQITFSVKDGQAEGLNLISKTIGAGLESEVMSQVLNYRNYKDIPNGKYALVVTFRIDGAKSQKLNSAPLVLKEYTILDPVVVRGYLPAVNDKSSVIEDNKIYDFTSLEKNPEYPGGIEDFFKYVSQTMKYPQVAREAKIQGKVLLSFIVEKDGSLTNVKVDRRLGGGTDEEAVRVIYRSIKWNPGVQNGKVVRVKYHIPITFSLGQ